MRTATAGLLIGGLAVLLASDALGVFLAMRMVAPFMSLVGHVRRVADG